MTEPTPIETDHPGRYVLTRPLDGAYVTSGGGIASGPFRRCKGANCYAGLRVHQTHSGPVVDMTHPITSDKLCPDCRGTGYQSTGPHPDHPPLEFATAREAEAFWSEHKRSLGTGWVWKDAS